MGHDIDQPGSFTFTPEHDGSLSVESAVFQALGAASMCWAETPRGVFNSDRAKEIGDKLLGLLAERDQAGRLAIALEHTQEYLGSEVLPPIPGWAWFDALSAFYGQPFVPADRRPVPASTEGSVADG